MSTVEGNSDVSVPKWVEEARAFLEELDKKTSWTADESADAECVEWDLEQWEERGCPEDE